MTYPTQTDSTEAEPEVFEAFVNLGEGEPSDRYRTILDNLDEAKRLVEVLLERKYDVRTTEWGTEMGEGMMEDLINLETVEEGIYGVVRRRDIRNSVEEVLEQRNHEHLLEDAQEVEA